MATSTFDRILFYVLSLNVESRYGLASVVVPTVIPIKS